ncbi:MAG: cysteine--tRNA ligase [Candidatus Altiarchaeota archaeon]|nr:cysteine--tRNA ligase [Candidatus Altiarchaeota archaeon]
MKIYNTLTKNVEDFKPIREGQVGMYVCGPTTYDHSHIGHARTYIFFDFFRRYLEARSLQVKLIVNLTDVDDKIIKKSKSGVDFASWQMVPDRYGRSYFDSMTALRVKAPFTYTSVSAHMQEIIEMVQELIEKGNAYEAKDGIYFDTNSFRDYGKLSGRVDEQAESQKDHEHKRSEKDFALWKFRKSDEPFWGAPFGEGRPGWHIECSAMARKYLGKTFDIHGGGMDLIFPHHENEVTQSEAANDAPFANYWVHSAFLTIDKNKMSKSIGNIVPIKDMLSKYPAELIRYYLLSSHYRTALDFTWEKMDKAREQWSKVVRAWYDVIQKLENQTFGREDAVHLFEETEKEMLEALDNDLQTPKAYVAIHKAAGYIARGGLDKSSLEAAKKYFQKIDDIFAILPKPNWTEREQVLAQMLVELRTYFRRNNEFKISDEVREHLRKSNVELDDDKDGSKIRFV